MPYKKPYSKRGYGRKRQTGFRSHLKTAYNTAILAKKAYDGMKYIKSLVNVEKKFVETNLSGNLGFTPVITPLSLTAQGDTQSNRQGDSIKATSNGTSMNFVMAAAGTQGVCRVVLVLDKVSNGAAPTTATIFDVTAASPQNYHYNPDFAGSRYTILWDKKYTFVKGADTEARIIDLYQALSHHIKYSGTTAAQASCSTGHLYLWMNYSDNTNQLAYDISNVLRFIDN